MTVLMLVMPTSNANAAIGYCSNPNDLAYISSFTASPASQYRGEQVKLSGILTAKKWPSGNGYYRFSNQKKTSEVVTYRNISTGASNIVSYTYTNGPLYMYSYKNNGTLSNTCIIKANSFTFKQIVTVKPAETVDPKVTGISGTSDWNSTPVVYLNMNTTGGQIPYGRLSYELNLPGGPTGSIRVTGNSVAIPMPRNMVNFSVYAPSECSSWLVVGNFKIDMTCRNEWFNNGQSSGTISYGQRTAHLVGANTFTHIKFTPDNKNIVAPANKMELWWEYYIWEQGRIKQVSNSQLWSTAVANGSRQLDGLSKAGSITKTLPEIDRSCAKTSTNCNNWQAYAKVGSGSYSWYALQLKSASAYSLFMNCEPEGGGNVTFKYYDYGQSNYPMSYYNTMKVSKDYTFNLRPPGEGESLGAGGGHLGLLGGFGSKPSAGTRPIMYEGWYGDKWDTVFANNLISGYGPIILSQPWGNYLSEMGNPSCSYPYPSAWVPSTTSISLPSSQWNPTAGTYVYSTVMPVKLASLEVRGGYGANNRSLNANPITIEVVGPDGRTRTTSCHASGTACYNLAIPGGAFKTEGNYSVRACWSGQTSPGINSRVFRGSCSGWINFRVYQTFACNFPEDGSNNITLGPDAQGQIIPGNATGTLQIIKSGDKIRVTYPNVTANNFKGLINTPTPPAGEPQIKGRTRLTSGSDPSAPSDVRLYNASGAEIDANRTGLEWNNGLEVANPVNYISYYWPSAITASGRNTVQIERRIWIWATAFDPTKPNTAPPETQWWSCDASNDMPHSAKVQIINSQLNE